jgi:hypothetical protein
VVFCLARVADHAAFASAVFTEWAGLGRMSGLLLSILSWASLYGFVRALTPAMATPREFKVIWSVVTTAAVAAIATGSLLVQDPSLKLWFYLRLASELIVMLLTFTLAVSVPLVTAWRLAQWTLREASPTSAKTLLVAATPLLGLHGLAFLVFPLLHGMWGVAPVLPVLWGEALLPWLLAAGFAWLKPSAAPRLAAARPTTSAT